MECSSIKQEFFVHSRDAIHRYENRQIPFAAVKIRIDGLIRGRDALDKIVCDNFRIDRDSILINGNDYAILMQNTSIEAAEAATHRLRGTLSRITPDFQNSKTNSSLSATAWIYGAGEKTKKLHFKQLDLINPNSQRKKAANWPDPFGEYSKWGKYGHGRNCNSFSIKA
jgi:hypothetical protein